MRMRASLRAFAAQAWLSSSIATPAAQVNAECSVCTAETVYISVGATEASISSTVGAGPWSLTSSTDSLPVETITPSALVATGGVLSYSEQPLPSSSSSESTPVVSVSTVTVPFGAISSPSIPAPQTSSLTSSTASGVVSTFTLTTTITSGYTPQVVETSTYTVIETLNAVASPIAAETTSPTDTLTLPGVGTPSTTSTASFTLTIDTTVASTPVVSVPAPGSPSSSSSLLFITYAPPSLSSVGEMSTTSMTNSLPGETGSAPLPTSVGMTTNVFTISLPGSDGVSPTVVTVTAVAPTTYNSPVPLPATVTETTTISSGIAEIPSPPPGPTTSEVVMTYTVTAPNGAALTTMTMSTDFIYTPVAGVGTSFITVSTATAIQTIVVTGTAVSAPFPNTTTPNLTTITPPVPVIPGTGVLPSASLSPLNATVSNNGSAMITSAFVPTGITTLVSSLQPTNGSFLPSPPETSIVLTASIETVLANGTAEVTTVFVPVSSFTTVAPVSGSATPIPPVVSANETGSPFLPPGTVNAAPGSSTSTSLVVPSNSTLSVLSSSVNETSLPIASVLLPTNSSLAPFPAPTNSTSISNGTLIAPSPGNGQSTSGAPPTASVNSTVPTSTRGPISGNAGPTAPPNGTISVPPTNQTAGGVSGQSAPFNSTIPITPGTNRTIMPGPTQSADLNGTLSSLAPNGTSPAVPGQTPPLNSTYTPAANGTLAVQPSPSSARPSQGGQGGQGGHGSQGQGETTTIGQSAPTQSIQGPSQGGQGQSQGGQGPSQGGQPQSQGGQSRSQGAQPQSQGGQGQSQGGQSRSQGAQPQSQGGQGQSQGGQSRSQGSQSRSQGGQGQPQGGQSQSQEAGQGGAQGGQLQSQVGPGQGGLDQSQTALGLPQSTPSSGPTTLVTSTTIRTKSSPGIKVRAGSPQATTIVTCGEPTDGRDVMLNSVSREAPLKDQVPQSQSISTLETSNSSSKKRFTWSDGFSVLPASASRYAPTSGAFLIGFSSAKEVASSVAKIGVGPLQTNPCFRFDFSGFRVGCASSSADCEFNVTGLNWDSEMQTEVTVASHSFHVPACSSQKDCILAFLDGDEATGLENLTSLLLTATADGKAQDWWADDLSLTWSDSTCKSALCRSKLGDMTSKHSRDLDVPELLHVVS